MGGGARGARTGRGTGGAGGTTGGGAAAAGLPSSSVRNLRQRGPDRHLAFEIDQDLFDLASLEGFDFDCAFLGLDHRDNITALDPIARLDQPFHQRARLHIGA